MGARFDRLRYEVFQNLFLSPMNTGSVRPAVATTPTACGIETLANSSKASMISFVATTPTACGIETIHFLNNLDISIRQLQQHLPLAVLKPFFSSSVKPSPVIALLQQHLPLAVLKPDIICNLISNLLIKVATTPTACGIETRYSICRYRS